MTPEEQRIAIALALGYTYDDRVTTYDGAEIKFRLWRTPGGGGMERSGPPNYPGDLNAMHEAEKMLNRESGYHEIGGYGLYLVALEHNVSSTAAQRAEAFLKTLNLWKP
jgi:hypothetical protein